MPSLRESSSRMRFAPQSKLSFFMERMMSLTHAGTGGRPGCESGERKVQKEAVRRRCQERMVAGETR